MTPEQTLNDWIRSALVKADVQRIENSAGAGVPDINVCYMGFECWVESKVTGVGARQPKLRKEQYAWGIRRCNAGGSVYLVAWDMDADTICMWSSGYGDLVIRPYTNMLFVTNLPDHIISKQDPACKRMFMRLIFPCFTS